jgi:hypothetical protein
MTFTVTLRTHSDGAHRRLARTLKTALRRDQLEAIDIREHTPRQRFLAAARRKQRDEPKRADRRRALRT